MAAVPVTINGIQTDENGSRNVTIVGMASITGLSVGGGPVEPPSIWPSPGHPAHPIAPTPPGIWPSPGHPAHPIVLPPVNPGEPPVEIWPSPGHPAHPIVLPPPPTADLTPEGIKLPPPGGGWGYAPLVGWGYFPMGTTPSPKA